MSQAKTLNQNQLPTTTIMQDSRKARATNFLETIRFLTQPMKFLETAQKSNGDIFTVKIPPGFEPTVFFTHPQAVEEVFATDQSNFDASVSTYILQPLIGDKSILMLDGVPHRRQRKLLMPPFHGARMATYGQLIRDITNQVKIGRASCRERVYSGV